MYEIYDNGAMLLGNKKMIKQYALSQIDHFRDVDEYVVETCKDILEEIKDYKDDEILCINYDNGMGISIDSWDSSDIRKEYY